MPFIGREKELSKMENMYRTDSFQMMVLYGRRRIGKTMLLSKFSEDKDCIFYTGIESKDNENLRELGYAALQRYSPGSPSLDFRSYSDIMAYITSCIKSDKSSNKHLIIIDEYPYIAESANEIASVLQREIDHEWKNLNIMLVLCGSSITFMEEKVLGEKSPLYGRRTAQMDLLPFDYLTSSLFVPDYSPEEKAIVYGISGGIPKYLSMINPKLSINENIISLFFDASGYFYDEPKNLLRQEFRDVSLYFAVLNAIGNGCTKMNEISTKTGFDTAKISQAIRKLESVRIVHKELSILNEKNKKMTQYVLCDGMFRFWFRFVPKGTVLIERGYGRKYFDNNVVMYIHDYMGAIFETICQDFVFRESMKGTFGFILTRVGKWRGNDKFNKCQTDIDVVGIDENGKKAVIGECKFKNSFFGKEEYEKLIDRGRLLSPYIVDKYLIFSLGGVKENLKGKKNVNVEVIKMSQLFDV